MTKANGEQVHVCTIVIWHPVPHSVAHELEKQCDDWRKDTLTPEERELAEALTSKLATERALLSALLQQLPSLLGPERDDLDERIVECEEKIALYNELLKPVRLHAAARVEGLTEGQGMWIPRAYGVLGREDGHQTLWREWLRAVAVPWVAGEVNVDIFGPEGRFLPLERYVVNMCGEVPLPVPGKTQIEIAVRELRYATGGHNLT
jgi:DENN (AEX-3) domain